MLALNHEFAATHADASCWPEGARISFVDDGRHRWRVVEAGPADGPLVAAIHGTGASAHSFGPLAAHLCDQYRIFAFDLPGHGSTLVTGNADFSLLGFATAIALLFREKGISPDCVIGHSAGTAIALRMQMSGRIEPRRIFGINSALAPIAGNRILSPMARLLSHSSFSAGFFTWQARHGGVKNLLRQTGSELATANVDAYQRLFEDRDHVRATIAMMANWDLTGLQQSLGDVSARVCLIAARDDPMVAPGVSAEAASRIADCEYLELPAGGHLVHEAMPEAIAKPVRERIAGEVAS